MTQTLKVKNVLEKWLQESCSTQDCYKSFICTINKQKKQIPMKHKKVKYNKAKYAHIGLCQYSKNPFHMNVWVWQKPWNLSCRTNHLCCWPACVSHQRQVTLYSERLRGILDHLLIDLKCSGIKDISSIL